MNFLGHDWTFWVALFGAAIVRVLTSPFHSVLRSLAQVLVSVFVAWAFTDAMIDYLHLSPGVYRVPVGALLALTADGIVRAVLAAAANPSKAFAFWRKMRGGGEE